MRKFPIAISAELFKFSKTRSKTLFLVRILRDAHARISPILPRFCMYYGKTDSSLLLMNFNIFIASFCRRFVASSI